MSDLVKLEQLYEKETALYKKHREKAENLRKRIDEEKGQAICRSVKNLNLSPGEFKQLQKALENRGNVKDLIEKMEKSGGSESNNGTGTTFRTTE